MLGWGAKAVETHDFSGMAFQTRRIPMDHFFSFFTR